MARQDELERKVDDAIRRIETEFADLGKDRRWAITRALVHRAVHHATGGKDVEFCALATYLAEMIQHAHKLAHGDNPNAPTHQDALH